MTGVCHSGQKKESYNCGCFVFFNAKPDIEKKLNFLLSGLSSLQETDVMADHLKYNRGQCFSVK